MVTAEELIAIEPPAVAEPMFVDWNTDIGNSLPTSLFNNPRHILSAE